MNCNKHTLTSGKKVYIYDNVFDFHTSDKLLHFVTGSYYRPIVDTDNDKPKGKGDNNTILMFYPNTNWHIEYGGDTLFLDESGEKVELFSQYTPGRIIILDGSIPHLARPSTTLAPHFRYSFVITFSEFLT